MWFVGILLLYALCNKQYALLYLTQRGFCSVESYVLSVPLKSDNYAGEKRRPVYNMQAAPDRTVSSKVLIDELVDVAANN